MVGAVDVEKKEIEAGKKYFLKMRSLQRRGNVVEEHMLRGWVPED